MLQASPRIRSWRRRYACRSTTRNLGWDVPGFSDIRGGGAGWSIQGPAILSRAGVKVAFFGPGASRRASPIGRLAGEPILNSAWAFRKGVPEVEALRMSTLNAAELLDMGEHIGSIEVGKDADFVVLEGHPFDYRVVPTFVFVDGRLELEPR